MRHLFAWVCLAFLTAACTEGSLASADDEVSVFELPQRMANYQALEPQIIAAMRSSQFDRAISLSEAAIDQMPMLPNGY